MRPLTRLEAHFLRTLVRAVQERESKKLAVSHLYLLYPDETPGLQLALRIPGSPLFFARVLIYGARPVRYQVELATDAWSARSRSLWDHCLGALNLVVDKTGPRQGRMQLFYEVTYPDAFLKRLGE
jgi:hypothetical protein